MFVWIGWKERYVAAFKERDEARQEAERWKKAARAKDELIKAVQGLADQRQKNYDQLLNARRSA